MGEVSWDEFNSNLKRGQKAFERINLPEERVREIVVEEIAKGINNPSKFAEYLASEIRKRGGVRI